MITITRYVDDLTFSLATSSSGCNVKAYSTSRTWYIKDLLQKDKNMSDMPMEISFSRYAVLDMGTNYCNLRNLVDGSR